MTQPAQPIEADAFYASLRARTAHGVSTIALDGGELPVSVQLRDSPALVFTFSGAVDRTTQTLPRFSATSLADYVPATVIALADPTLSHSEELTLAWYAGHEGFELQKMLPDILGRMIESLGATRVAFAGSSGGGYAALYYSWHIPDSIAVVSNPQTNLDRYIRAHRRRYITACWSGRDKDTPLSTVIEHDLGPIYAQQCENTVIYLQVASDFFHVKWHFSPFAATLPRDYMDRLIVRMENWGNRGHHPVPTSIWIPWMLAALTAPDTSAASIEATWDKQNPVQLPRLKSLGRAASVSSVTPNERPHRSPSPKHRSSAAGRDTEIATELARNATNALLGPQASDRSAS